MKLLGRERERKKGKEQDRGKECHVADTTSES